MPNTGIDHTNIGRILLILRPLFPNISTDQIPAMKSECHYKQCGEKRVEINAEAYRVKTINLNTIHKYNVITSTLQ